MTTVANDLGTRTIQITREIVARYMVLVGERNSLYEEESPSGKPPVPAAILYYEPHHFRVEDHARGHEQFNNSHTWEFLRPVHIDDKLTLHGRLIDRYLRRNRDHVVEEMTATNAAGALVYKGTIVVSHNIEDGITPPGLPRRDEQTALTEAAALGQESIIRSVKITYDMCLAAGSPGANWHNNREMAQKRGFSEAVVAGPHMLAITSEACTNILGTGFLEGGKLALKFVRPVIVNDVLTVKARVKSKTVQTDRTLVEYDVIGEKEEGGSGGALGLAFVGTASGYMPT